MKVWCRYLFVAGGCAQNCIWGVHFTLMLLLGLMLYWKQKLSKVFRYPYSLNGRSYLCSIISSKYIKPTVWYSCTIGFSGYSFMHQVTMFSTMKIGCESFVIDFQYPLSGYSFGYFNSWHFILEMDATDLDWREGYWISLIKIFTLPQHENSCSFTELHIHGLWKSLFLHFFFLSVDYGTYFDPLEGMLVLIYLMTADLHSSLQRGCSCFENQQCLQ